MSEYIEKEAAMNKFAEVVAPSNNSDFERVPSWNDAVGIIEGFPPSDVRPVVRGRWIPQDKIFMGIPFECSICGEVTNVTVMGKPRFNYCPMCGAMMEYNDA